jgi:hypothetical protein
LNAFRARPVIEALPHNSVWKRIARFFVFTEETKTERGKKLILMGKI